jgi:hypothetical protein
MERPLWEEGAPEQSVMSCLPPVAVNLPAGEKELGGFRLGKVRIRAEREMDSDTNDVQSVAAMCRRGIAQSSGRQMGPDTTRRAAIACNAASRTPDMKKPACAGLIIV